ncbi:serine O-acetyltransferase [Planotetraspora sp. A-T 1434]|uniref:serine O-acetyltransferase EpsC n=1 Tax=Planotetraspora sp. A-T 1434 TaxID=2979219 RepID=UPI0021BFBBEC|nr:serine O-acetyltransferase EpsC [Planotetraspora sp. A-T 1434]MCT9933575.1 serine O-acetyltransferase [Planotetraspora sp. A-T 1434]
MTGLPRILARAEEDLHTVMVRDPSIHSVGEALLHPMIPAIWAHRLAHALIRRRHRVLARLVSNVARVVSGGIEIHPGAVVGRRVFIDHGAAVVIGETAVVGDDVTIYQQVTLGAVGWWRDSLRPPGERRHPRIGDRVVVGANATVLGPIDVGDDAVIGAQSLVLHDVAPGVHMGAPAAAPHHNGMNRRRPRVGIR